jgi:cell division septum initiation protein DivIVA
VPATRKVLVDRDAILEFVDQLRVAIPEEVQAAKRINAESERILEKAGAEGQRIVSRAQEQAAFLISERGLTEAAAEESQRIVAEAQQAADEVRRGADDYALQMLESLEREMDQALAGIRKGLTVLDDRRAELRAEEAEEAAADAAHADDRAASDDGTEDDPSPAFLREGDAGSRSGAG